MKKKGHKKHEEEAGEAWLLPYSDLMTLLLAVFIVLFAVSKVDQKKSDEMSKAFQGLLSGNVGVMSEIGTSVIPGYVEETEAQAEGTGDSTGGSSGDSTTETTTSSTTSTTVANTGSVATQADGSVSQEELRNFMGQAELSNLQNLEKQLNDLLVSENLTDVVSVSIDLRGLVINLNNAILFDSGSAEIKPENKYALSRIAQIINGVDNYIRVEGHTDNRPISTSVYPSNWELSTARADRVVRLFTTEYNMVPQRLEAVGYGEYRPIADNSTEDGRIKNRRIEIIILSKKYNNLQQQN